MQQAESYKLPVVKCLSMTSVFITHFSSFKYEVLKSVTTVTKIKHNEEGLYTSACPTKQL